MKYPQYDPNESYFAEKDGNYPVSDFTSFVSQLLDLKVLSNPVEKGVIELVNEMGTNQLTAKQGKVLDIIVSRYNNEECKICGVEIPLSEVLYLDENDGMCSYHKNQFDKDKD